MSSDTSDRLQHDLELALVVWRGVPDMLASWEDPDQWDRESKMNELLEWPMTDSRVERLRKARSEGRLAPEQQRLMDELEALIARWGPQWHAIVYSTQPL